jgi:hypothetical protein
MPLSLSDRLSNNCVVLYQARSGTALLAETTVKPREGGVSRTPQLLG